MEADKTVLDRAGVIEVNRIHITDCDLADIYMVYRPPSSVCHRFVRQISKLQRLRLGYRRLRLMSLILMGRRVQVGSEISDR
jgi:hypothetical protein